MSSEPASNYILFTSHFCPFAQRASITRLELGSPLTSLVDVSIIGLGKPDPENKEKKGVKQPFFQDQIWPKEKKGSKATVPVLFRLKGPLGKTALHNEISDGEDGTAIPESKDVMVYLAKLAEDGPEGPDPNAAWLFSSPNNGNSNNSVYPKKYRKEIDEFLKWIDVGAGYGIVMTSAELAKQAREDARAWTLAIEKRYAESPLNAENAPYFLGDQYSLIDISIVPFFERFVPIAKAFQDFDLLTEKDTPRLLRMFNAARQRPSMRLTTLPAEWFVSGYQKAGYTQVPRIHPPAAAQEEEGEKK